MHDRSMSSMFQSSSIRLDKSPIQKGRVRQSKLSRKDITSKSVVQHLEEQDEEEDNRLPGPGSYDLLQQSVFQKKMVKE